MSKTSLFLFGAYGRKSTGDDAMLYAIIYYINFLYPEFFFTIMANEPVVIPNYLKKNIEFVKPTINNLLRGLIRSSDLIIGGGTSLHDYGTNKIRWIIVIFKILLITLFSKIIKKRVIILANGIGPIKTSLGKYFMKIIMLLSDFISVRDNDSLQYIKKLGLYKTVFLGFDPTVLFSQFYDKHKINHNKKTRILGISILPVFKLYFKNDDLDTIYIKKISKSLDKWLRSDSKNMIKIFVLNGEALGGDYIVSCLLRDLLYDDKRVLLVPYASNPLETLEAIGECDFFVGMRYHSLLFAYLNNLPILVINYHPKCDSLRKSLSLPQTAMISMEEIIGGMFEHVFMKLFEETEIFISKKPVKFAVDMAINGMDYFKYINILEKCHV